MAASSTYPRLAQCAIKFASARTHPLWPSQDPVSAPRLSMNNSWRILVQRRFWSSALRGTGMGSDSASLAKQVIKWAVVWRIRGSPDILHRDRGSREQVTIVRALHQALAQMVSPSFSVRSAVRSVPGWISVPAAGVRGASAFRRRDYRYVSDV